jgi:hypothetical protein
VVYVVLVVACVALAAILLSLVRASGEAPQIS